MTYRRVASRLALLCLSSVVFLTGCAKHPKTDSYDTAAGNFQNTKACKSNEFLQRYGCSLDRVEQAAESNDPDAMYALGYMYYYGVGTVRDTDTAIVWISRAAGQNQPLAIKAMNIIRKKQFSHQGQTKMAASSAKGAIPNTDPHQARTKHPYVQQFTKSKPKTPAVHLAKAPVPVVKPAAVKEPVANANASSNWAGADAPSNGVIASHTSDTTAVDKEAKRYTLQIMAVHHLDVLKQFLSSHHLGQQASYYHTYFQNKNWYVLIYGDYPSVQQAKQAMHTLPKNVQRMHPWVKSYRTVQKEILQKRVI
ncbi:MAG: SPOR domain-containing protein [Coxiellaceae bacterium]|nr:SPOR domain-containing protein [Coxiellaceae bacterium]